MSTSGRRYEFENNYKYYINIICKDKDNDTVVFCNTINNKELKAKNVEDLEDYLELSEELNNREYNIDKIILEEKYLSYVIANYSKEYNNGIIDWSYKYSDLTFRRMLKLVKWAPITVVVIVTPKDIGSAGGMGPIIPTIGIIYKIFSWILKILKWIYNFILEIITIKNRYNFFEDNYGTDKKFIHSVINNNQEWKRGFIDSNIYDTKAKYEKKIMKDCNYRFDKKDKCWHKKYN